MSDNENLPPLEEAKKAVLDAEIEYQEATTEEAAARTRRTGALNRLNAAQKAFDAVVDKMKARSGRDSEWFREKHPPRYEKVG